MNRLEFHHVEKKFWKKKVLCGIDGVLEDGVYGLLGSNGAGKTTLLRCITNAYAYQGSIALNGKKVSKRALREIGYLPQRFSGYPELTVEQMLEYFCNIKRIPHAERKEQIETSLRHTNLEDKRKMRVRTLSGGMVRRLGIAQAVLGNPKVVILDEPTSGLDPKERNRFKQVIDHISGGRIVILSTHIVEDIEACCDRTLVMDQGKILFNDQTVRLRQYGRGRILELTEEELASAGQDMEIEKTHFKGDKKVYRIIVPQETEDAVEPTVEDGYLCLLKKNLKTAGTE